MKVNMYGKRYCNESVPYDVILNPLQNEKNGVACMIWDSNYRDHVQKFNTIGCSRMVPSKSRPGTYEGMGRFMIKQQLQHSPSYAAFQHRHGLQQPEKGYNVCRLPV